MDPVNPTTPPITPPSGTPQYVPLHTPTAPYDHEHTGHVAPIRTFSSDLANAVREKGGSVVRIAIAEEEKHRREFKEASIASRKNIAFIIIGILILCGAIGGIIWSYTQHQNSNIAPVVVPTTPPSIIHSEAVQNIDISGYKIPDIFSAVQKIVATPNIQAGTIKNVILTQGSGDTTPSISVTQFLSALSTHIPPAFLPSLEKDFMLGVYQYDHSSLFLVIHGTAHDFLLSGMLGWEPYLFNDMTPLFNIDTSTLTKAQLQNVTFRDAIVENRDSRAAFDANGKLLLFYSFIDQNTILITNDAKTMTEVVRRL